MLIRTFVFLLLAFPALAAPPGWKYYVGTGSTPCAMVQSLDAQYCAAVGCDGVQTVYWFPIIPLKSGVCTVQIVPGDGFQDVTLTLPPSAKFPSGKTVTLTAAQISALVTRASLAGQLPDTLTLAQFEAIPTTAQLNALNAVTAQSNPTVYADWQEVQAAGYVDQEDPQYIELVTKALSAGLITAAEYSALTTPAAAVAGP